MSVPARGGLALVSAAQAQVGIWGLVSPRGFFDGFPGAGHRWVATLGPYNEHLVRDYAAAELGLSALLLGAALWFGRQLVLVACVAFLVATLPHLAYHLSTTSSFSTADNIASLGAFGLEIALILAAIHASWHNQQEVSGWPGSDQRTLTESTRSAG